MRFERAEYPTVKRMAPGRLTQLVRVRLRLRLV
jgi:hypothetical protein